MRPQPVKISTPLFDALPATEPLNTPVIPGAGAPSQFNVARGAVVGSVLSVRDLQTDADNFYVLLRNGVQPISPFVASLLRSANSFGDELPVVVAPDRLASVPVVETLPGRLLPDHPARARRHRVQPGHLPELVQGVDRPILGNRRAVG